jgi:O-succinylbenzoic acid--CoA ligase
VRSPTSISLPDWLAHRAATAPAHEALVAGGRRWRYAELDADVVRLARRLAALGARDGDRVATLLPNGPAAAMLVHAALRLGVVLVPLNIRLSDDEIAWQVSDCGARMLLAEESTAATAEYVRREQPHVMVVSADEAGAARLRAPFIEEVPDADAPLRSSHDPAAVLAIIYTSGTTGRPKGAMLTVGNFWWSAVGSALNLGTQPDDRWLACMPLFHVGGLSILVRAAIYGITVVVHDRFDATEVNRAIEDERVTIVSVVAVMLERMLEASGGRPYPPTLRCVLAGGGPVPLSLLERCTTAGVPVVQTYGLTESCSQVATLAPSDAWSRAGAAGKALYPNELRVLRPDGTVAAADEAGEIVARGPVVMAGYAGQPEATERALSGGWLHTGDVGRLDADGFLYVLDRRDDLIVTGGENVYPSEVESALLAHPAVTEAGVIGLPDDRWGQRVVAFVRLGEGAASAATGEWGDVLRAHCRSRLGGYKVPREIRIVAEPLPRTASGKLRRSALRTP